MHTGLTIGDFSRITHLSVKTLRRYHEAGLLEPAEVDPLSGYRYYSLDQVPTAQVIRRFRDLDMPVREVREVLAAPLGERAGLVAAHLDRLEARLEETRAAVVSLRRLLDPEPSPVEVELQHVAAVPALAVSAVLEPGDVQPWYAGAMAELLQVRGDAPVTGPPGALIDEDIFTRSRGEVVLYLPMTGPRPAGRVEALVVPAAELAVTVHHGPHDDIDVSYGALGRYVTERAIAVAGPVRERYLVGPADSPDPAAWRTEIARPAFSAGR